jgi:hypothetical protein
MAGTRAASTATGKLRTPATTEARIRTRLGGKSVDCRFTFMASPMVGQGRPGFPALQRHRTREDSYLIVWNAGLAVGLEAATVDLAAALSSVP